MRLDAITLTGDSIVTLSPAPARRAWMDRTPERFAPRIGALDEDSETAAAYRAWREGRAGFLRDLAEGEDLGVKAGWQRDYFLGRGAQEHQTKMVLAGFERAKKG